MDEKEKKFNVKKFFKGLIYVDDPDEDDIEEKKDIKPVEEIKETPREEIKEVIKEEIIQEKTEVAVKPVLEKNIISKTDSAFITLEKTEPVKKEEEVSSKVKPVFHQVEILSPLGPSVKRNDNNPYNALKSEKKEEKEYKTLVKVISITGPAKTAINNDDIAEDVANMTIDDFISNTKTEYINEKANETDEINSYTRQLEDVFNQSQSFDAIIDEDNNKTNEPVNVEFNIPTQLKTKKEQQDDEEIFENLSLFDFLEDK